MTGHDVAAAARSMLGTPWMHQGRIPGVALDCAGLVICVARQLGIVAADFDVAGYGRAPDGTMLQICQSLLIEADQYEVGCVLALEIYKDPQHLGIVGEYRHGGLSLIHGASKAGRVIETRLMFANNQRLRGVYKFPGVDYGSASSI